ncbi:OR13A protein, partial [Acromyrmex charruanus]
MEDFTLFRNHNYKADIDYVVKVAKTLLTPVGIWPLYRGNSKSDKIKNYLQTGVIFGLMCYLLIPHVIYTFFDAEDLTKYMKVVAAQVFSLLAIIKFWTMIINREEIRYCLQQMEMQYRDVECEEDRLVMMKSAKIGRLFTVTYLGLSYGGALPYHIIMPLLEDRIVKEDNTTQIPLPYLSDYVLFIVKDSPFYEITFVSQILISSIILSTNCGVYSLIATCVMHSCCLFEVVRRQMETVLDDGINNLHKRFGRVIEHHMQAIKFAEMIEKSLNIVFLCEMVGCTIIICFLEFGVLKEWEDGKILNMGTYFVLMTSIFVNVFIISAIGDRLKEEVNFLHASAYDNLCAIPSTIPLPPLCCCQSRIKLCEANNCRTMIASMSPVDNRALFQNFNYRSDAEYVLRVAKILLTPVGIWPLYGDDSTMYKIKYYLQTSIVFCLMCFLLVPHIIYTFFDAEDLTRYMKVIAAQMFSLLGIIKFWTMIINKNDIKCCLKEMEIQYRDVESEEDRLVMVKNAKVGRQFTLMYLVLLYGGALPYHIIMPLVADKVIKEDNTTHLPLPYLSDYVFFVVEDSPFYEILFVVQIVFSTMILSTNCGVYSLIASCVMHACCLFEIARRHMETLLVGGIDDLHERFNWIITNHMRALRYVEMIENSLNIVFLSEMILCTIIICFLEYGVLKEWEDSKFFGVIIYFILVTSIFVNVFTLSTIGDRLKEESGKIGEVSYSIDWYTVPTKNVNSLIMVMIRSNRPSTLTAAKMFDISLQSFCEVCKTSMAYLNFIRMLTK